MTSDANHQDEEEEEEEEDEGKDAGDSRQTQDGSAAGDSEPLVLNWFVPLS